MNFIRILCMATLEVMKFHCAFIYFLSFLNTCNQKASSVSADNSLSTTRTVRAKFFYCEVYKRVSRTGRIKMEEETMVILWGRSQRLFFFSSSHDRWYTVYLCQFQQDCVIKYGLWQGLGVSTMTLKAGFAVENLDWELLG